MLCMLYMNTSLDFSPNPSIIAWEYYGCQFPFISQHLSIKPKHEKLLKFYLLHFSFPLLSIQTHGYSLVLSFPLPPPPSPNVVKQFIQIKKDYRTLWKYLKYAMHRCLDDYNLLQSMSINCLAHYGWMPLDYSTTSSDWWSLLLWVLLELEKAQAAVKRNGLLEPRHNAQAHPWLKWNAHILKIN